MKTVKEMAALGKISVRTLHHYDAIGLLKPTQVTEAGYRLYNEEALEKLYLILLYREIGFSLEEIKGLLEAPDYDRNRTLEKQVELLKAKAAHLQNRIQFANGIKMIGVKNLKFDNWDPKKIDEYSAQAQTLYGQTDAWKEFQHKSAGRSGEQEKALGQGVMELFEKLGTLKALAPEAPEVQAWVKALQGCITEHFYNCTKEILLGLGEMYAGGGSMTENIDAAAGTGTAAFAREAIRVYCDLQK